LNIAVRSDAGKERLRNEDNYYCKKTGEMTVFAVADGMGGHAAGDVASLQAVETIGELVETAGIDFSSSAELFKFVENIIKQANSNIYFTASQESGKVGMGTTLTAGILFKQTLYLGHVGDSRAYRVTENSLERLTRDHSMVEEMMEEGRLSPEEARLHPQRNILTRALGTFPEIEVDIKRVNLEPGDGLLFCTDGLTSLVEDEEILRIIKEEQDPEGAAARLVENANARGGYDNITLILSLDIGRQEN